MRFNCKTNHGDVLAVVSHPADGASVRIEWTASAGQGGARQIEYRFAGPIKVPTTSTDPARHIAHRALSHFNRADGMAVAEITHLRIEELEPDLSLHLDALA